MQPLTSATSAGVTLSFGLLNLVVSVHGAVAEDDSRSLRTVCTHEHPATPIKQHLACPHCGNAGEAAPFEKAKAVGDGYVVIPAEVIEQDKAASAAFKKQITITAHPAAEVTGALMPSGKTYYLSMKSPTKGGIDTYRLLAHLVRTRADLAFMCKFTLRSATSLFRLTVAGDSTLVLAQMAEADLVREHPQIPASDLDARALELGDMLADQMLTPFVVADHGTGKSSIIAAYANAQTPVPAAAIDGTTAAGATVLDITAQLESMLAATATPEPATVVKRTRTRKSAAAKQPAA